MPKPLDRWRAVILLGAVAFSAGLAGMAAAVEPQTWVMVRPNDWEAVKTPTTAPSTDAMLDQIEGMIQARRYFAAKKLAIYWLKQHKVSPLRDRGLFLLGQADYFYDDKVNAYYAFDELLDKFPSSHFFNAAVHREYDIGSDWLRGEKRKFLGLAILDMEDEGIEILYRVQQRAPGSPLAETALLQTADHYYASSQFDLANDVYRVFIKRYPRSSEVPRARLRQAFSNLAQFRSIRFDITPLIDAREQLLAIEKEYPDLAAKENLDPVIHRINTAFALKILETGDYYERVHQPVAAVYQYRFVIKAYPDSPEAKEAKRRLAHQPASALKSPEPGSTGSGLGPATQAVPEGR